MNGPNNQWYPSTTVFNKSTYKWMVQTINDTPQQLYLTSLHTNEWSKLSMIPHYPSTSTVSVFTWYGHFSIYTCTVPNIFGAQYIVYVLNYLLVWVTCFLCLVPHHSSTDCQKEEKKKGNWQKNELDNGLLFSNCYKMHSVNVKARIRVLFLTISSSLYHIILLI